MYVQYDKIFRDKVRNQARNSTPFPFFFFSRPKRQGLRGYEA